MHFVICTQYYPPEIGAPQNRLSNLAGWMVRRGHKVTVLTAMPNYPEGKIHPGYGGMLRRETRDGVEVIRTFIFPTKRADFLRRLTNYFSFVLSSAVFGLLLLRRPDYIMVESPPLFLGLTGFFLSRVKRARLIFNVSDLWPETAVRLGVLGERSLAYRLSAKLEAFCYRNAWLVTGQSKSILQSIEARFPACRTFHLSNGVDVESFGPDKGTAEARAALGGGECVVLYAGLHGLAQGLGQVLGAAEVLRAEPGLKFVLIGDGPEKEMLREKAREIGLENLSFFDSRPAREIPPLLASADVLLVPLKMYIPGAVPSKLYEAMASGRPVVLIADGEAAEIVRRHQAGVVVEPGAAGNLAQAVLELRQQPERRRLLGEGGRRAAEECFDREKIAGRFIEFLEGHMPTLSALSAPAANSGAN